MLSPFFFLKIRNLKFGYSFGLEKNLLQFVRVKLLFESLFIFVSVELKENRKRYIFHMFEMCCNSKAIFYISDQSLKRSSTSLAVYITLVTLGLIILFIFAIKKGN